MTAAAAATGLRGWLVARYGHWFTPRRKKAVTSVLLAGGVLAGGLVPPV